MPEQLLGRIIRACSNENEVVVDPFSGSATTLAVAKKLNRRFLGCELSVDYAALGMKRLDSISMGDLLDGAEEPKLSAPKTTTKGAAQRPLFSFHSTATLPKRFPEAAVSLIQAFANVNRGYSADRIVADPVMNQDFQTECGRLAVDGTEAERNRLLFRLRKAGQLKRCGVETEERTAIDWAEMNQFVFASEIAWRQVGDLSSLSLDEILCDPRMAAQFDQLAAKFAPGFAPLHYRWGAMKLRKEGRNARLRAQTYESELCLKKLRSPVQLHDLDFDDVPVGAGVYGIAVPGKQLHFLYAAETSNLQSRLKAHLESDVQRQLWLRGESDISVLYSAVPTIEDHRLARQSLLLKWHKPAWNLVDLLSA